MMEFNIFVRDELPEDLVKIRKVNTEAFDTETEARLVDRLRKTGIHLISLVAEVHGKVVGHILFSPVKVEGNKLTPAIAALAPMAVLPEWQNKGVGSRLVEIGLKKCKDYGYDAVVVLGFPEYYSRLGFVPSVKYGIDSEYEVPPGIFMIQELEENSLKGVSGTLKYHQAFKEL